MALRYRFKIIDDIIELEDLRMPRLKFGPAFAAPLVVPGKPGVPTADPGLDVDVLVVGELTTDAADVCSGSVQVNPLDAAHTQRPAKVYLVLSKTPPGAAETPAEFLAANALVGHVDVKADDGTAHTETITIPGVAEGTYGGYTLLEFAE